MPEILLHYIWQKHLWAGYAQKTTDGKEIEIISVGQYNIHAGPDFCNAHIRIGEQEWIGNVEMHIQSSDWNKHHHDKDAAYDNTILHVVCKVDNEIRNSKGRQITQCELRYPHEKDYMTQWLSETQWTHTGIDTINCSLQLLSEPTLLTLGWKHTLLTKRLECKRQSIIQLLDITQQSWLHAFYISLAHNFGFHTNGIPFETLAIQTPLSCLQKHRNSLFQLTAILLGQSGLLNELSITTSEEEELWTEYQFLKKKFQLSPMNANMWKKARMRPQNAPTTRIRQFAYLLQQSEFLFANLMNASDIKEMVDILRIKPLANTQRISQPAPMGLKSIEILLINTIIPYRYTYSLVHNPSMDINDAYKNLELIPAEDNTIIRQWKSLGQSVKSAADTQALLHLYQNYCQPHLCYNCQVGYKIFSQKQLANL